MTQPFLYMLNRSTTAPQCSVFKEVNRQLVKIGNDFGTTEDGGIATTTAYRSTNKVIHWGNNLYALNGDAIYTYNVLTAGSGGTGDWEVFHTFANPFVAARDAYTMGFTPCSIDGSGVLVTAYPSVSSNEHGIVVKIDKELNVIEGPETLFNVGSASQTNDNNNWWVSATPYRNSVVFAVRDFSGHIFSYDLKSDIVTRILPGGYSGSATPGRSQIATFRDKLFFIEQTNTGQDVGLYRLDGGSVILLGEVTGGANHNVSLDGCYALIPIGDRLYLFGTNSNDTSYQLWEIELDINNDLVGSTNVSSLLPAGITSNGPGDQSKSLWRIDLLTNGPENPVYEIEFCNNDDNTRSLWTWNTAPTGNDWTFQGNAMTGRQWSWVDSNEGSSSPFIWAGSGVLNVSQPCLSLNSDGLAIDISELEIFGTAGTTGVALQIYFDKEGEIDTTRGTINSPSAGSLSSNTVIGLSVGDKLSLKWEAVTDGIRSGDNPKVHARIFIP